MTYEEETTPEQLSIRRTLGELAGPLLKAAVGEPTASMTLDAWAGTIASRLPKVER